MTINDLIENFELLENWEDRYRYIIELGAKLPSLSDVHKTDTWKVQGCTSQVWLVPNIENGRFTFQADSDAAIVRGLLAILQVIYGNISVQDIKNIDAMNIFAKLGLDEHLTPSRRNGLFSMVEKIRSYAKDEHS